MHVSWDWCYLILISLSYFRHVICIVQISTSLSIYWHRKSDWTLMKFSGYNLLWRKGSEDHWLYSVNLFQHQILQFDDYQSLQILKVLNSLVKVLSFYHLTLMTIAIYSYHYCNHPLLPLSPGIQAKNLLWNMFSPAWFRRNYSASWQWPTL